MNTLIRKKFQIRTTEGFIATVTVFEDSRIEFIADGDIDADGANGQNGQPAAYLMWDKGTELLANGGLKMSGEGRAIFAEPWARDIFIATPDKSMPMLFPNGVLASKTAYRWSGVDPRRPAAYLDAETVAYVCVQRDIINCVSEAVMGCWVLVENLATHKTGEGIVGDIGPLRKLGEISIQMARLTGVRSSPRTGGEDSPILKYTLYPGQHGFIGSTRPDLMRSNGRYIAYEQPPRT